jgi:hypothetical protein
MDTTILHHGPFTAILESDGTVTLKAGGKCPTLDDMARQRAQDAYMWDTEPTTTNEEL